MKISEGRKRGEERNAREERASHIAAALGLAKPRAGPVRLDIILVTI